MEQDVEITITEEEFNQFAGFIKSNYGLNLNQEKKTLVLGRLSHILARDKFKSFNEYFNYVLTEPSGKALITLLDKITTNHTFFMREPEHFNFLRKNILPQLTASVPDRDLRIWSAGCSSGEEPYTLAMILDEYLNSQKVLWNAKILATDISTNALENAKRAEYHDEQVEKLPKTWQLAYFNKIQGQKNVVVDHIKNEVIYRRLNLMETHFPFKKKFHVIYCRNVMIYFDTKTKTDLVEKFYQHTEPGGYLFIGHSETLNNLNSDYKYIMPSIYRKE